MSQTIKISFTSLSIFIIMIPILFIPIILNMDLDVEIPIDTANKEFIHINSNKQFSWPTPRIYNNYLWLWI